MGELIIRLDNLIGSGARGGDAPRNSNRRGPSWVSLAHPKERTAVARISANPKPQLQVEDSYLIALAKAGSDDAYDRLVRRYYRFVRLKASSYFLVGGDSEDLIQ